MFIGSIQATDRLLPTRVTDKVFSLHDRKGYLYVIHDKKMENIEKQIIKSIWDDLYFEPEVEFIDGGDIDSGISLMSQDARDELKSEGILEEVERLYCSA